MTFQQGQLEELQRILMTLPDKMQRVYARQRNRTGALYTIPNLILNPVIPVFSFLRFREWKKWEEKNWLDLWERFSHTGQFPLLDLVSSSLAALYGMQQKEIERMTKGFWQSRLKIGSDEKWIAGIERRYGRKRNHLLRAEKILRQAPETLGRFQRGELSFEQAKSQLKEQMSEGRNEFEYALGSVTPMGAARFFRAEANHA